MNNFIRINGIYIDLGNSKIVRNIRISEFGDVSNLKSNYSFTFKIPKTSKNVSIFEMLGVFGNTSNKPYKQIVADYGIGNTTIVRNGILIIRESSDYYNANLIDGIKELSDILGNKTLSDLDYTDLNHTLTETIFSNSQSNTSGYIYAFAEFGKGASNVLDSELTLNYDLIQAFDVNFSLPIEVFSNDTGGGAKNVTNVFSTSSTTGAFYQVITETQSLNFDFGVSLGLKFTINASSANLLLKQYRSGVLYNSRTIDTLSGDIDDIDTVDNIFEELFTDVLLGDYFILSVESVSGAFELDINSLTGLYINVEGLGYYEMTKIAPSVFVSTLIDKILNQAGFTYSGDIFTNTQYLAELIPPSEGYTGLNIVFENIMGEFKQIDLLKDIVNRYGIVLILGVGNIDFVNTKNVLNGTYGIEDWSSKISGLPVEKYSMPLSIKNNFKYNYVNESNTSLNSSLLIDNENVNAESDLYVSSLYISEVDYLISTENIYNVAIWEEDDEGTITNQKINARIFTLLNSGLEFQFKLNGGAATATISSMRLLSLDNLEMSGFITDNYTEFKNLMDFYKLVKWKMNLNVIDIMNLNFTKLKFIKLAGRRYFLSNIVYNHEGLSDVETLEIR